jgi:hypothetical protein
MFAANPQGLQQRYAMNQDLLDLLALQKLKKDKEAAQRSLQMQMQPESGTVKDQLEGQMMQATKQEVAASLAPGLQQQGQMMQAQQMQQAMGGGVASQPAPNMVGMARGGIVGYAPGGDVQAKEVPYSMNALRAFDERRRLEQELRAAGLAEEEARALAQDPASAQNVLRSTMNVRNMPSEAPKGIESVLSEGTTARDIPVSMDALSRQDARRAAERAAEMERRRSVLTGDPIADNIIQSRRAAETMTPEQAEYLGRRREEPSRPSRLMDDLGAAAIAEGGMGMPVSLGDVVDFGKGVASEGVLPSWLEEQLGLLVDPRKVFSGVKPAEEYFPRSRAAGLDNAYGLGALLGETATAPFKAVRDFLYPDPNLGYATLGDIGEIGGEFGRGVVGMERGAPEATEETASSTPAPTPSNVGTVPTTRATTPSGAGVAQTPGGMSAEEAAMQAMEDRAGQYQATDEDIAAITETLPAMQQVQREAPQDPRMSRYEAQLARLEAEETDKLGALIAFLQGAGASGGTNLGATLMGGGSGIQARDARIRDEMTQTLKNIETLQLQRDELAQQESQFGREQDFTRSENQRDRESREREARAAADAAIAKAQFEFDQYADEAERELNGQAAELTMQDPEFITARKKIMEQYAGGLFSDANPAQAQADISALYSGYFSQKKRQLTGMGMSGAGGFSGEYVTP